MSSLIGKQAPLFEATAVQGQRIIEKFRLSDFIGQKYVVLFFYPKDFTFVCPTELHAFQQRLADFEERNAQLIACSTDSEACHLAWLRTAKADGGIEGVTYPIVADINRTIAEDYGVLAGDYLEDEVSGEVKLRGQLIAYRGLFLIDRDGIVQHMTINNMPLGRSVDEVLRMVDALQFFEKNGEVCPANWRRGEAAMEPTDEGLRRYLGAR